MQNKFQSIISLAISAFAAVTLTSNTLAAGPLDLIKQELPIETIGSLAFFNGEFFRSSPVYSGVWSSPDGKSWTKRHPSSHAQGLLISTGQELVLPYWFPNWNTQILFRSSNGENWTGTPLPTWVNLSDLAYGNNAFVGIPRGTGLAWRSAVATANGTEWLRVSTNLVFQSVDFLNTNFLAWAYDQSDVNTRFLGSSADGLDWTFTPLPPN